VQETFIAGLKSVDKFEHKSSVKTWLYSILKRKIVDHWRAEERRKTKPISYFQEGGIMNGNSLIHQQPPGILAEIELKLENDELAVVLKESLALLPEKWRIIITEKLIEDRKSEDICNDYNISPANLWVIIHRAKLQLRASLQARWYNK
jgi:RNA polymerase sigma-70 factor (ECF subfamily)